MARRRRPPQVVGDALQHVLQRIDPERRLAIFRIWAAEVGDAVAKRASPVGFRDGILSVRVSGAAWMQELQFAKEDIRARLNRRLGVDVVRDVYFVAGSAVAQPAPATPPRRVIENDDDGDAAVEIPPLRDPRLAEVFARIAKAHRRRRRSE
jgi:predicted nucleic acid-binding Zn ribbon protein